MQISDEAMDAELARLILHEDLGYLKKDSPTTYHLDEDTRDRLIAHARQDAAHAVVLSSKILERAKVSGNGLAWISILLNVVVIAILLYR